MTTQHSPSAAESLINALVGADVDAVRGLFSGPADIDDPERGRQIDGGFVDLVQNWAPARLAAVKNVAVKHATWSEDQRFSGTEIALDLEKDGSPKRLDVMVIGEHGVDGKLVKTRLYYRLARVTGAQNQRWRILPEEPVRLDPMPAVVREYQDKLREGDADGQADTFDENGVMDFHGESQNPHDGVGMGVYTGREHIRETLSGMFAKISKREGVSGSRIEKLNVFGDGATTIIEFNINAVNHPSNRTSAGVAAYEIGGSEGKLIEARIYDEAW